MGTRKKIRQSTLRRATMTSTQRGNAAFIVLARLDSNRLPGKGLMDLGGKPLLSHTVARLRQAPHPLDIILATSDREIDDPLETFAEKEGVACFRGDAADVAGRCLAAMEAFSLDWFVRICGDSPFIDPEVSSWVVDLFIASGADIATNVFPRSYPVGSSAEAVSKSAMQRICAETDDVSILEHVTAYAYSNPERFRISNLPTDDPIFAGKSIAVDTPEDLERAQRLLRQFPNAANAPLRAIVDAMDRLV